MLFGQNTFMRIYMEFLYMNPAYLENGLLCQTSQNENKTSSKFMIFESLNPICHGPLGPDKFRGGGLQSARIFKNPYLNHHLTMKFCIYPQDTFRTRL